MGNLVSSPIGVGAPGPGVPGIGAAGVGAAQADAASFAHRAEAAAANSQNAPKSDAAQGAQARPQAQAAPASGDADVAPGAKDAAAMLREYGFAATATLLDRIGQFAAMPGINIEKAVLLASNGVISITGDTSILAEILSGEFNLGHELAAVAESIVGSGDAKFIADVAALAAALAAHGGNRGLEDGASGAAAGDNAAREAEAGDVAAFVSALRRAWDAQSADGKAGFTGGTGVGAGASGSPGSADAASATVMARAAGGSSPLAFYSLALAFASPPQPYGSAAPSQPTPLAPLAQPAQPVPPDPMAPPAQPAPLAQSSPNAQPAPLAQPAQPAPSSPPAPQTQPSPLAPNVQPLPPAPSAGHATDSGSLAFYALAKRMIAFAANGDGGQNAQTLACMRPLFQQPGGMRPLFQPPGGMPQAASSPAEPGVDAAARAWDALANKGAFAPESLVRTMFASFGGRAGLLSAESANKLYADILARLALARAAANAHGAALAARAEQAAPGWDALVRQIGRAHEGASLVSDLNNRHQYMLVPLFHEVAQAPVELFVMKRGGRRKKIDAENATFLLSVGTRRLGRVEALVHLGKNRNVSVCVRAASEAALQAFKDSRPLLHRMLGGAGFKLARATYRRQDEKLAPDRAMAEASREFRFLGTAGGAVDIRT